MFRIAIFGICGCSCLSHIQAIDKHEERDLYTLDSFHYGGAYLVQDSATAIWTFDTRQGFKTFGCDFFFAFVTDIDHAILNLLYDCMKCSTIYGIVTTMRIAN